MRTYQSQAKDKKGRKSKRAILYSIVLTATLVAVALVITLSLTLGKDEVPLHTPPDDGTQIEVPVPGPSFVLPMAADDFSLGRTAVLDRLVYNSSMNQWRTHNGMDFLAEEGASVVAISDGTVVSVQHTQLDAGVVVIRHAGGLESTYKGLAADIRVEEGDTIEAGDSIGTVASVLPRRRSEGSHLYLETRLNGKLVNPLTYLPEIGDK
ncbi:MAG: M23 family metallopeptidase [Firmicutes bacterium]|nr:M23 family metallopeptidase [Bacillota bacterium]